MPRITGRKEAGDRIRRLSGQEKVEEVGRALVAAGELIDAEASHLITKNAVSGKNHVPSLPGQPPNEDTGVLRTNIEVERVAPLRVHVISGAPYAAALERGTSKGLKARPYMGPAARNKKKEAVALINAAVNRVTRKR